MQARQNQRLTKTAARMEDLNKKIESTKICEQDAIDNDYEIDEEKLVTEITNLENQLRLADEKSIKIQRETQLFDAFEAKTEKDFEVALSDLEARGNKIKCKMPLIVQDFENLKASLMDKKMSLEKLEQEDKQLDDDCAGTLEKDTFSKLESENKKAATTYAEKIELRNADSNELARISKLVQEDVERIKDNRSEIEKLTLELNDIKDQKNPLNISSSEIFEQYDELGATDAISKSSKEIDDQTEAGKQNIFSMENTMSQKIQGHQKKLTSVLEEEESSDLDNKNIQMETQLEELRQKKEANNKKLATINKAKEETDTRIKHLKAKMGRKERIEPIPVQQSALEEPPKPKIRCAPDTAKSQIPRKKLRRADINWYSDDSVTDEDPDDLLSRLLKGNWANSEKKITNSH
ncbi:unnamed protein product [Ceutorhynchus assimilis]|uniref:Uncharacterized protein n=1 Tax=Ceutorhynchus assimilis TaxID=467358 RepID=A0A9N9QT34_9CUCU|nr:unnamed protein product [Ceutorhynchus assimilis]